MDNQSPSINPVNPADNRQQANTNPDRPPIDPDNPNTADPFDPFETAIIADGGGVIQDQTEQKFETHLSNALPTTDSPQTPTTPSPPDHTSPTSPDPHTDDTSVTTPIAINDDTLIHTLVTFIKETDTTWQYILQNPNTTIKHHAVTNGNSIFSIHQQNNSYYVSHNPESQHMTIGTDPIEYQSFERAMAAFIEGIDWGSLPPGNGDPQIWMYEGYHNEALSFQHYLSGTNNTECGDHYFANQKADYSITIESYTDRRPTADTGQTLTILTVTNNANRENGTVIYRTRFPGQQTAFNTMLTALHNGLSNEIALHTDTIGNTDWIPSIETLQHIP